MKESFDSARIAQSRAVERESREQILRFQAGKLIGVASHVAKSPFWRDLFAEVGFNPETLLSPDNLYRAPTLDKHAYAAALAKDPVNYGGFLTGDLASIREKGAIAYRTTGTSGKQGKFINSNRDFGFFAAQGHDLIRAAGGQPGDAVMVTWPLFFWAASWGFWHAAGLGPYLMVPGGPPADTEARLALIREYRPAVIVATPSYAVTLTQAARDAGMVLSDYGLRGILMGGETFGEKKRKLIEEAAGLPGGTRNFYGISEGGPLFAVECACQNGLHLFEGDTIHQFWDTKQNIPAAEGDLAEHVFTSLSQKTMATWFNFRTRDAARYSDEPCECGLHTRRMWIAERLDDMVKVKGINIFASGVEDLLTPIEGVGREFKLNIDLLDNRDRLTLQLELEPSFDRDSLTKLVQTEMQRAWGISFEVECLPPETLQRTEGKARRWQDNRPKD